MCMYLYGCSIQDTHIQCLHTCIDTCMHRYTHIQIRETCGNTLSPLDVHIDTSVQTCIYTCILGQVRCYHCFQLHTYLPMGISVLCVTCTYIHTCIIFLYIIRKIMHVFTSKTRAQIHTKIYSHAHKHTTSEMHTTTYSHTQPNIHSLTQKHANQQPTAASKHPSFCLSCASSPGRHATSPATLPSGHASFS